jgi:hypothetical protein
MTSVTEAAFLHPSQEFLKGTQKARKKKKKERKKGPKRKKSNSHIKQNVTYFFFVGLSQGKFELKNEGN